MSFKIATWNVNSLRVRLPHVLKWLNDVKPDVLAIQETKLIDDDFPYSAIQELGYFVVASGQKTYNGVAILSRTQTTEVLTDIPQLEDAQRRILSVTMGDLRILNLYVPNGESILSDKFRYKMNWLKKLDEFLQEEMTKYQKIIILGDFNIAPDERDVHDVSAWQGQVLFSDHERQAFRELLNKGFHDCFRLISPNEKHFSWWDYRLNSYKRNMGLRIDHILISGKLAGDCNHCYIDKATRGWERPSDHAPVVAEFNGI